MMWLVSITCIVLVSGIRPERVPLIVFGVDGFGYELYQRYGDHATGELVFPVQTVFPSVTFANFMSIATGLHPTQHGIIYNQFYNRKEDSYFKYNDQQNESFDWYKGEPIWITAKKAGLRVYSDMWVASAASFGGIRPDVYSAYDKTKTVEKKIEDLVINLDSKTEHCDFYIFYTNEPDHTLHRSDITNETLAREIIKKGEEQISLLIESLGDRKYNLVVVSDHGMAPYKSRYTMDETITSKAKAFYGGALGLWYSYPSYTEYGVDLLTEVRQLNEYIADSDMEGVTAIATDSLPTRFQLCGMENSGKPEIMLLLNISVALNVGTGNSGHGYDNTYPDMYGQVRVRGPAFKENASPPPLHSNTELYNLFCSLLDIRPSPNTGSLRTFDSLLKSPPDRSDWGYERIPLPCGSSGASGRVSYWVIVALGAFYLVH